MLALGFLCFIGSLYMIAYLFAPSMPEEMER